MGLDQYFYKRLSGDQQEQEDEVVYFRKNHELHTFIGSLGYDLGNGTYTEINPEDLARIATYLSTEDSYWGKFEDEDAAQDATPTKTYLLNIGTLYYFAANNISLFYSGDW
jgi:hypothetical protein